MREEGYCMTVYRRSAPDARSGTVRQVLFSVGFILFAVTRTALPPKTLSAEVRYQSDVLICKIKLIPIFRPQNSFFYTKFVHLMLVRFNGQIEI